MNISPAKVHPSLSRTPKASTTRTTPTPSPISFKLTWRRTSALPADRELNHPRHVMHIFLHTSHRG